MKSPKKNREKSARKPKYDAFQKDKEKPVEHKFPSSTIPNPMHRSIKVNLMDDDCDFDFPSSSLK